MEEFKPNAVWRGIMAAAYLVFMTIAFYASTEYRGGYPVMPVNMRYVMDMMIIAMAFFQCLITADFGRLRSSVRMSVIWLVPLLGIEIISMVIWLINCPETSFIIRGSVNIFCAVLNVLCIAAAYSMFGTKTAGYTFGAMAFTMTAVILDVMRRFGAVRVLTEYGELLRTFAGITGKSMEQLEMHDLIQGLGVFSMYYLFCIRQKRRYAAGFLASSFFFSVGLKRIDVIGIIAACMIGVFYNMFPDRIKKGAAAAMTAAVFVFVYGYLILIKSGQYTTLMEQLGINTMSRDHIYEFYRDFYELSPSFIGNGVRYIYKLWSDYRTLGRGPAVLDMPHNEFMTYYIELGFWGFVFWLWSNTWFRISYIRKRYGTKSDTMLVMAIIYSFITYVTDNTFFYYSINIAMYAAVMAYTETYRCRD